MSIRPTIFRERETIEITPNDDDISLIADLMAKNNGGLGGAIKQALSATLPDLELDVSENYNERICLLLTTTQANATNTRNELHATATKSASVAPSTEDDTAVLQTAIRVSRLLFVAVRDTTLKAHSHRKLNLSLVKVKPTYVYHIFFNFSLWGAYMRLSLPMGSMCSVTGVALRYVLSLRRLMHFIQFGR